jgi:organic radical activating enzyme
LENKLKLNKNLKKLLGTTIKNLYGFESLFKKFKVIEGRRHKDIIYKSKIEIDNISETFCTAKWLQVSLLLHNGTNHSCHHPPQHKIDIEEIKRNPSALHNTKQKKEERNLMLKGERPSGCEYCWDIEDLGKSYISDRMIKSTDRNWSLPYLGKIKDNRVNQDINPSYLEVAFESTCNLKCAYCSPDISTSWYQEVKKYGPYPTRFNQGDLEWIEKNGRLPIKDSNKNEYIEAFWKWWPELYSGLKVFRITGGEPLLSDSTWKVLELINLNPKSDLTLSINTNLSVAKSRIDKLIEYTNTISEKIEKFEIHTSCEAVASKAEYIRYGLDYKIFIGNVEKVLKNTNESVKVNMMITFNVLSSGSLIDFLEEIKRMRSIYKRNMGYDKLVFMISILRWPSHLSIKVMPKIMRAKLVRDIKEYTQKNMISLSGGFLQETEIDQINRLCEYMSEDHEDKEVDKDRIDFKNFINEYDRRKDTNFREVFPEFIDMIN